MKVKSESEVAQLFPTLGDPMDCSLPGSSAHGIFQARVLEWVAIAFSKNCHMTQQSHYWAYTRGHQKRKKHMYPNVHCSTIYNG